MAENKNVALFIACFLVIALLIVFQNQFKTSEQVNQVSTLGIANIDVSPDEAQIFLSIETNASNPKDAQDQNSLIATRVISALVSAGVQKDNIETTSYNIEKIHYWNPKIQQTESKGYHATHSLKVTIPDFDYVGKLVGAAVSSGVNNVDNIVFTLSKQKEQEVKSTVLGLAAKNAREKANDLAASLGVKLGKIKLISESSYNVAPFYSRADMLPGVSIVEKVAPPIQPASVNVQAQVSVAFEISQ